MRTAIIVAVMTAFGLAFTGCDEGDNPFESKRSVRDNALSITLNCVNGYVFAVYDFLEAGGLTQVWELGEDGLPKPQLCPPSTDSKKLIWE